MEDAMTSMHARLDPTPPLARFPLLRALADNWWLLLLRGIVAIVFGILAFVWPGLTLLTLTFLWGSFAIVDGVLALWATISGRRSEIGPRWWLALVGVAGVFAGMLAFAWPGITAQILLLFIAVWSIIIGVMQIAGAFQLRKEIEGEWLLGLSGLLAIAFGAILIVQPAVGALALVWVIACYAILAGCDYIALAFQLRKHRAPRAVTAPG
jgi:uncharacterized membrane protein HdeD (DUF308 family)